MVPLQGDKINSTPALSEEWANWLARVGDVICIVVNETGNFCFATDNAVNLVAKRLASNGASGDDLAASHCCELEVDRDNESSLLLELQKLFKPVEVDSRVRPRLAISARWSQDSRPILWQSQPATLLVISPTKTKSSSGQELFEIGTAIDSLSEIRKHRKVQCEDEHLVEPNPSKSVVSDEEVTIAHDMELGRASDFLAVLSHELRNPVAALAGGFDLMQSESFAASTCKHIAPLVSDQLNHIRRLLDDLLDVARLRHGKLVLTIKPLYLKQAVTRAAESNQHLLSSRNQKLELKFCDDEIVVAADRIRLDQAIANIINNASRFSEKNQTICICVSQQDCVAMVRIKDDGIGIEPGSEDRLFQPFAQLHRDNAVPLSGLGLGLAISRELIRLLGGDIVFNSGGEGAGSEFIVTLPISNQKVKTVTGESDLPNLQRILVVEDSLAIRTVLTRLLSRLGHDVTTAESGEEAIEKLQQQTFDSALVDIQLPGISGYDVATWVRNNLDKSDDKLEQATLCLIAVTGFAQPQDKLTAKAAGFDAHLSKPVNLALLAQTLTKFSRYPVA